MNPKRDRFSVMWNDEYSGKDGHPPHGEEVKEEEVDLRGFEEEEEFDDQEDGLDDVV